jgi:hypothetical protein
LFLISALRIGLLRALSQINVSFFCADYSSVLKKKAVGSFETFADNNAFDIIFMFVTLIVIYFINFTHVPKITFANTFLCG